MSGLVHTSAAFLSRVFIALVSLIGFWPLYEFIASMIVAAIIVLTISCACSDVVVSKSTDNRLFQTVLSLRSSVQSP